MKALPKAMMNTGFEVIGTSGENTLKWKVDSEIWELALNLALTTLAGVDELIFKVDLILSSDQLAVMASLLALVMTRLRGWSNWPLQSSALSLELIRR